jgi:tRNA A-37 threonylcarbamoyl transferase component Bud32
MRTIIHINTAFSSLAPFINELAANGVPSDATLIYKARNQVFTVERGGYKLNIKAFRVPRFPNSIIYGNIRKSKARRSMENAQTLVSLGIGTPTPVAYIERRSALKMHESYYVSVQLDADNLRDWTDKPDCEHLLSSLAAEMVHLHKLGVYHKDFSPGNVLYTSQNGTYKFYLIDLNRMKFGVFSPSTLMRNFRSIYIESETETVRLARLYAEAANLNPNTVESIARAQFAAYHKQKNFNRKIKNLFK